ncbi:hypothetical protein, partial [Acidithiobacillus ferriphilus]|uniref:hypothetical protein n=1 Tax=Acidithiobacillus ferriphilus TaxID=1689834 RepID=UPI004055F53F
FAGIHVLRRLSLPRHPPYALIHLTIYPQASTWRSAIGKMANMAFPSSTVKEQTNALKSSEWAVINSAF